ncbi:ATP synthase complex assembly protein atp12 [Apophysomyces sp. BC1034]|nr:ATP synthase complex assembly protein atp12 [Apophysomyces sp. BC1015]KAG0183432.1 ATP synthase complex assembly protein atp12 [Apophysomyces sp. BC1021]KAG0193800.1 ATP synthase complex assembly protein atp12 [Apophysomyces sp. BC1034]
MATHTARLTLRPLRNLRPRSFSTYSSLRNEAVDDAKAEAAAQRAERTMQRFWKRAGVKEEKDGWTVVLDHRNLRTPSKQVVKLPLNQHQMALLTAAEWDAQTQSLKMHTLPLTSILARSLDAFNPTTAEDPTVQKEVVEKLMTYFDTDAICYHEDFPEALTELQDAHWKPLIEWASKTYDVQINTTTSIFAVTQPKETRRKLQDLVEEMDALELAAFERAVMSSKSFLIGLALVKKAVSVEQAAQAAHVEVNAQIDRWGEVEDSHDVEREYIRQTLGSVACAVMHKN